MHHCWHLRYPMVLVFSWMEMVPESLKQSQSPNNLGRRERPYVSGDFAGIEDGLARAAIAPVRRTGAFSGRPRRRRSAFVGGRFRRLLLACGRAEVQERRVERMVRRRRDCIIGSE